MERHRETLPEFRQETRRLTARILCADVSEKHMQRLLMAVLRPESRPALRAQLDQLELEEGGEGRS
jgi:hypothetical protein